MREAKAGATAGSPRRWTPASPLSKRTRRQLVEEGFMAVLARKYNSNSARRRIFDWRGGSKTDRADPLSGPGRLCPDGACVCSRRRLSNCTLSSAPATTQSGGR